MMKDHLLIAGIMTGNSLDAADVVLSAFYQDGKIEDIEFVSVPYDDGLYSKLKHLREFINENKANMGKVVKSYRYADVLSFDGILDEYMEIVAKAVKAVIDKAKNNPNVDKKYDLNNVDLIGFHGQTCAHLPPSQARGRNTYTIQIGNGQKLADMTGISVVYDFRSDDLMMGGEGAPLAPKHNEHLAEALKVTGDFPVVFVNAGNTGNLSVITYDKKGSTALMGWDAGPFNHFPDMLVRKFTNNTCDIDGKIGRQGKVNKDLLEIMFDTSAIMSGGGNFIEASPPKSSDPQWYKTVPMLEDDWISFEDKVRTVEYFSAYLIYHSLGYVPEGLVMPGNFALFGGGWKNPVIKKTFEGLVKGDFKKNPVLLKHKSLFSNINKRIHLHDRVSRIAFSNDFGFDSNAMEARIFADMAFCKVTNQTFTTKATTGARKPVVCGVIRLSENPTKNLKAWMRKYKTNPLEYKGRFDPRWSRASAGWEKRIVEGDFENVNRRKD